MIENKRVVKYVSFDNTIRFPSKINSFIIADFASSISEFQKRRPNDLLTLNFSAVMNAYSNGMLPIIATVTDLRRKGQKIRVDFPNDNNVRKIFIANNWGHYLSPEHTKISESTHDKHLVTRQFSDYKDLGWITKDFMDIVLRNMRISKDIISALEWSMYELCDNVLNHSESKIGGFVQVITFAKQDMISFGVADAGRGILSSLKEGIPTLSTDVQAIGEAIKAGVTRNKEKGQGNGLAGSLRVTTMTGGSLDIISGKGRFIATSNDNSHTQGDRFQSFQGTSVHGQIKMNNKFSIEKALDFGGPFKYVAVNTIDLDYEMPDQNCLLVKMNSETTGLGTRHAGKQMRNKIINFVNSKPTHPIIIDWSGIPVISSSFADEYMGKLFLELGPLGFSSHIRNKNMEDLVHNLLDKAISQRLTQAND